MSTDKDKDDVELPEDDEDTDDPKESLIQLLKTCRYCLRAYDRENGKTRKHYENPIMTSLVNYLKLVENEESEFDDFKADYLKMFKKHCDTILSDKDSWLCDENNPVIVHIGDSKSKRSKKKCALHLSSIYQKSAWLFDKYASAPLGPDGKCHPYQLLPTRIIHHLYLLFLEVSTNSKDIDRLGDLIEASSGQLGITDGTYTPIDEISGLFGGGSIKDSIASLMKIMFSSAKKYGIDVPEGSEFDLNKLMAVVERIMSGKSKDGAVGQIVKRISSCTNSTEVIGVFKELMTNQEVLEDISNITGIKVDKEDIKKVIENEDFESKVGSLVSEGTSLFTKAKETITESIPVEEHNPEIQE